jgi:putative transposase
MSRTPTCLLLGILAGWINRQQQAVIEYQRTENEILKRQLEGRRLRLTDDERRRLAVKGRAVGRKEFALIVCLGLEVALFLRPTPRGAPLH